MSETPLRYTECGLPNVELVDGFTIEATPYGEAVRIHDVEALHRSIGRELAHKSGPLTGAEVKFLRRELDMTQKNLAKSLGVETRTVQRWEGGDKPSMEETADAVLRMLYLESLDEQSPVSDILRRLAEDAHHETCLRMSEKHGAWSPATTQTKSAA